MFVRVALPLPVSAYRYCVPDAFADRIASGMRVVVPLRQRELVGIVVEVDGESAPDGGGSTMRDVLAVPDADPLLPTALLETAGWMSGYYGAPLGLVLKSMLPAALWGESDVVLRAAAGRAVPGGLAGDLLRWLDRQGGEATLRRAARALRRPMWPVVNRLMRIGAIEIETRSPSPERGRATSKAIQLAGPRLGLMERDERFAGRPARRRLYEALEQAAGPVPIRDLRRVAGVGAATARALVDQGLAVVVDLERMRDPFAALPGSPPPAEPAPDQHAAIRALEAMPPGQGALVFGVTGSGKTLVYLEAIRRSLDRGQGAIVLVPEIGLTPQTVSRVRGMFGDQVAVLHSALSDGERADAWRALARGERQVAVGARSAVFAPLASLGYVVVDEEHEASYKNGEAPRYHARDVAAVRCRLQGARLVLGSATPSLETAAGIGTTLTLLRLPARVAARPLPPVELVDLRTAPRVAGVGAVPWTVALDDALRAAITRGDQALLLLNRRGYAAFLYCPACGAVRECRHCSISLTLHRSPPELRCHYCGEREPVEPACPACGAGLVRPRGVGTQQVEQLVAERLPGARIARMDLDTTGSKWAHQRILDRVARREIDVLVGTQMVAKGIDFPDVTLVGVIDADTALHLPDFRAAERTFQLITQVAGRAGRGPRGGRVIVQTREPEHHALRLAARHDTEAFWAAELALREHPPYPPATTLANVVVSGPAEPPVRRECDRLSGWLAALAADRELPVQVVGPAPCPVARIKDRWRWHVLLKGPRTALGRVVRYAAQRIEAPPGIRIVIDRDPVNLL